MVAVGGFEGRRDGGGVVGGCVTMCDVLGPVRRVGGADMGDCDDVLGVLTVGARTM